eukprot:s2336_g5.t3
MLNARDQKMNRPVQLSKDEVLHAFDATELLCQDLQSTHFDWTETYRRQDFSDPPLAWCSRALIANQMSSYTEGAMKGLTSLPGYWRKVLSLLEKAGHYTNLCDANWDDAYLAAAFFCQELKWRKATAILEVMAQRRSHQVVPLGHRVAWLRCAAVARWDLAFATWRAARRSAHSQLSSADAEASVLISTIEERLDRSSGWLLAVELICELQRRRLDFAESLCSAQKLCSKSSQWASVLALQGLGASSKDLGMDLSGQYYLIKAACRSRQWQEALALLTDVMLPTQLENQAGLGTSGGAPGPTDRVSVAPGGSLRSCVPFEMEGPLRRSKPIASFSAKHESNLGRSTVCTRSCCSLPSPCSCGPSSSHIWKTSNYRRRGLQWEYRRPHLITKSSKSCHLPDLPGAFPSLKDSILRPLRFHLQHQSRVGRCLKHKENMNQWIGPWLMLEKIMTAGIDKVIHPFLFCVCSPGCPTVSMHLRFTGITRTSPAAHLALPRVSVKTNDSIHCGSRSFASIGLGTFALAVVRRARTPPRRGGPRAVAMARSAASRAYGEWESPITASFITAGAIKLGAVSCDAAGVVRWMEGRPQEAGRQVVCSFGEGSNKVDLTPKDVNARTRVHEYGGVPYWIGADGALFYTNFADQRLYLIKSEGEEPICLTPFSAYEEDRRYRFADCVLDMPRNRIICVREDHTDPKPSDVKNSICALSLDGSGSMEVLVEGHDFYAAPKLSPDGTQLAFLSWCHPSMPWDSTQLTLAQLGTDGKVDSKETICGDVAAQGDDAVSVLQPCWSPSGVLHFIADLSGWWNLYSWDSGSIKNLYPKDAEFAGAAPGWQLGQQNYCFLPDGRCLGCFADRDLGASRLVDLSTGREYGQEEGLPRYFGGMSPSPDGLLYFLGGGPAKAPGLYSWRLDKGEAATMLLSSMKEDMQVDDGYISKPELIEFPTANGETAYGFYYPPSNVDFSAPEGESPPLLVKAHGGPTAQTSIVFNPALQFWTSRGFAVLDVDYRGSTGYGRAYRMKLKGNWGIVDIEDVCAGAEYLVKKGLADPKRLAIDGGSAGGYTTLGALTFRDVFTAGCSLYGVADLATLAGDTHKFESRYLDGLVGAYPEQKAVYEERAPICHTEKLACPILLLQGDEDKIVPPNQAELMYDAVKARGLPCSLKIYEGEQHGFRRASAFQ